MAGKKYYVVTFLQQPYPYIERYVCVPQSWVTLQPTEKIISVCYPNENPAITRNRVENNEKCNTNWTAYRAEMKYITDEYDDADTWIATMYDDGVVDSTASSTPNLYSSVNATNLDAPWKPQDPSTSASTCDHPGKSNEDPPSSNFPLQSSLKRKLSTDGTDEDGDRVLKTIKTEPLDENDNYSSNTSENKENSYFLNPINQERLSTILIDDINDILDMMGSNNEKTSLNINKTLVNPLANNFGELAKLLLDDTGNKNENIPKNNLESSSQKHSESECLELTIKDIERQSPLLIDVSDGDGTVDNRDKADKNNLIEEEILTQPNKVTPIQSEEVNKSSQSRTSDLKSLLANAKENQLTRPFEKSDCRQGKLPQQAVDIISDTQRLINLTVTHGILNDKPQKPHENDNETLRDPKSNPGSIDKPHKNPENEKDKDNKLYRADNVKSLLENTPTVSNEPFKLPQESIEEVNSSAFKVLVKKDKLLSRIIITRSDETELEKSRKSNNERVQRKNFMQKKSKKTLLIEPPSNAAVHTQNPLNALTSPMQRLKNSENQALPITRHLNAQAPPPYPYPQSNAQYLPEMIHRYGHDRLPQAIERMSNNKPQEHVNTSNPNTQAKHSTNTPKIKGYLLEDPRTGKVFVQPTLPENIAEKRPEYHNQQMNKNVKVNKPVSANQANHPEHDIMINQQFVKTSGGGFYPSNQQDRLPRPMNMHNNNPRSQTHPQHPHVPNSYQLPNYFDSHPQGRRFSPATQDSNYQDPRVQQPVERPPVVRPGPNEIRPLVPPNFSGGYQNYPPMRNVGDERFSSHPFRPYNSYEARIEEWFMSLSQKLDCIYAKLSKM